MFIRRLALALAAGLAFTACAAGSTDDAAPASDSTPTTAVTTPATDDPAATDDAATDTDTDEAAATDTAATGGEPFAVRRELPLELTAASDIDTNLLPPIEVHDVGQDRMVNFRNIFPAERPVLLWMWAPY